MDFNIRRFIGTHTVDVYINDTAVGVTTPLDNYLNMLVDKMGNPATVMTKKGLLDKLKMASREVEMDLKREVTPYASHVRG